MIINERLVRQLYVVKKVCDGTTTQPTDAGDVLFKEKQGQAADLNWFSYVGAKSKLRSDILVKGDVDWIKFTNADKGKVPVKSVTVAINDNPVAGTTYELRIAIRQAFGTSDLDTYYKFGVVKATSAMTTSKSLFYEAMLQSLKDNFKRENNTWFEFELVGTAGSYTGIKITEAEQPFELGRIDQVPVYFDVFASAWEEDAWGTVTTTITPTRVNSKKIAALEYFLMGERGDQYRNHGWPYIIKTDYLADASLANGYDILDIQYHFAGMNEDVNKSPKTITIVMPKGTGLEALADKVGAAVGVTVQKTA